MTEKENKPTEKDRLEAQGHFEEGKRQWALGNRGAAISEYNHAVALDPGSAAATALKMATEIMDFFDPQQLNP